MSISDYFSPSDDILRNLSYRDQKKVKVLTKGNTICFIMFLIFSIALLVIKRFTTAPMIFVTCITFLVSSLCIKKGKMFLGSYITTIGIGLASFVIAFFTSFVDHPVVSYRTILFCVTMSVLNYMISLKRGQIILNLIFSTLLLFASNFILHMEAFKADPKEWISGMCLTLIGLYASNLILLAANKSNDEIVEHSETEHKQVSETLNKITSVLNDVKETLNIGKELNSAVDNVSSSVTSITNIYNELISETKNLTNQVALIQESSNVVDKSSGVMAKGITEQNNSLSEVSSAITQISANISNIDSIAAKRREGMSNITSLLETQNKLISKLIVDVNKVQESSHRTEEFVETVNEIAQQTNLLAMNASIEAAHAGDSGKGFGVIAQEIRKLSEETTLNANKISDTLQTNSTVVKETTDSVATFASAIKSSGKEIEDTLLSIEEILRGVSEIDAGTKEIMGSINKIVSIASDNNQVIDDVVEQIQSQSKGIESITNGTGILKERVESISTILEKISEATEQVHDTTQKNESVSVRIAEILQ